MSFRMNGFLELLQRKDGTSYWTVRPVLQNEVLCVEMPVSKLTVKENSFQNSDK